MPSARPSMSSVKQMKFTSVFVMCLRTPACSLLTYAASYRLPHFTHTAIRPVTPAAEEHHSLHSSFAGTPHAASFWLSCVASAGTAGTSPSRTPALPSVRSPASPAVPPASAHSSRVTLATCCHTISMASSLLPRLRSILPRFITASRLEGSSSKAKRQCSSASPIRPSDSNTPARLIRMPATLGLIFSASCSASAASGRLRIDAKQVPRPKYPRELGCSLTDAR
mmetsp:Transcript_46687/g.87418  ORF Transcript_46687/g.87418 Transcript_46687/m.87418 type:complete len:225 (+) Transcript_46687:149-823(+)